MKVEVLRCFKSNINGKVYGEYYIYDSIEKYLVCQNGDDVKVIEHLVDKKVRDCVAEPTQRVVDAINEASEKYLSAKSEVDEG